MARKYMYLPDKNGNITKCGAHDHNNCPYHLGPDGKPLKHYDTPEEARKAYEKEQAENHETTRLSKKTNTVSGFLSAKYQGMNLDEVEDSLRKDIESSRNESDNLNDYQSALDENATDLKDRIGISSSTSTNIYDMMKKELDDYRKDVGSVIDDVKRKIEWCKGDEAKCRQVLRQLEKAHPGSDYGSDDHNMNAYESVQAFLSKRARSMKKNIYAIEPFEDDYGISYDEDKEYADFHNSLINAQDNINETIGELKGISGIKSNTITTPLTDPKYGRFNDYEEEKLKEQNSEAMKRHPKLMKELEDIQNEASGVKFRIEALRNQMDHDHNMLNILPYLKTMRPVSNDNEKAEAFRILSTANSSKYLDKFEEDDWNILALSDDKVNILVRIRGGSDNRILNNAHGPYFSVASYDSDF